MIRLPFDNYMPETQIALEAVYAAAQAVMNIYNKNFSVSLKEDAEPLTQADIESNKIIQNHVSKSGIPLLSEEIPDSNARLSSDNVWIIDPLDGTTDFVNKTGEFTIMIALVNSGKPVLGVICNPTANEIYVSQKDKGAFKLKQGKWTRLSTSNISNLTKSRIVGSRFHISDIEKNFLQTLGAASFTSKGSSLKAIDISSGNAEIYFTTTNKIKQWDTCASYSLVIEAGGKMTDMSGSDLQYNTATLNHENGLLVTNGLVHKKIIQNYNHFLKDMI